MKLNQTNHSIRVDLVAAIIFMIIGLSVWPSIADNDVAAQGCDWSGWWNTSAGDMELQQSGGIVTGTYGGWAGSIQGNASGNKLIGIWSFRSETNSWTGDLEFNMSDDCKSFSGRSRSYGDWGNWTGTRILKRVVSENIIGNSFNSKYAYPSPDYTRIAYVNSTQEGQDLVVAGPEGKSEGKPYKDSLRRDAWRFSPDSRRFAYLANVGGKGVAVVDGVEGKAYDEIPYRALTFSPDSQHIAYRAKSCDNGTCKWVMVLDGVEQPYHENDISEPVFSPPESGSKITHLAYSISTDNGTYVVVDGKMLEPQGVSPVFSPDGKRLAYSHYKPASIVLDGVSTGNLGEKPTSIWLIYAMYFSPDSKRFVYDAIPNECDSGAHVILSDIGRSSIYCGNSDFGPVVFSPDSKHLAYRAFWNDSWKIFLDDKEGKGYNEVGGPIFSSDSEHMAYIAKNDKGKFVVQDGNEGKNYSDVWALTFSPDSKRIAYVAKDDKDSGKQFVVVDGQEGKRYGEGIKWGPFFSPDSKHEVYVTNNCYECSFKELVIVDEVEEKIPYDAAPFLDAGRIVFDSDSTFHYLAESTYQTYLVEESLGEALGRNTETETPLVKPDATETPISPSGTASTTVMHPTNATTISPPTGQAVTQPAAKTEEISNNWNIASVVNAPSCSPSFTISQPYNLTYIDTYHWNYGKGTEAGGTIGLRKDDGTEYGPWQTEPKSGQGGVPNAWWIANPYETLQPGTYTVIDSDPSTWSQNSGSEGCGFSRVEGYPVSSTVQESYPQSVGESRTQVPDSEEGRVVQVVPITQGNVSADWKGILDSYRQVHGTYMQAVIALSNLLYIDPPKTSYEDFDTRRLAVIKALDAMEKSGQKLADMTEPLLPLEVKSSTGEKSSEEAGRLKVMANDVPIISCQSNTMEVIKRLARMGRENPAKAAQAKRAINKLMSISKAEYEVNMQNAQFYQDWANAANEVKLACDLALVVGGVFATGGGSLTISSFSRAGISYALPEATALTPSLVVGIAQGALGPTQALYSYINDRDKIIYGGDKNRIDMPWLENAGCALNFLAIPTGIIQWKEQAQPKKELANNLLAFFAPGITNFVNSYIELEVDPMLPNANVKVRPLSPDELKPKSDTYLLPPLAPGHYLTEPGTGTPIEVKAIDNRYQEALQTVNALVSSENKAGLEEIGKITEKKPAAQDSGNVDYSKGEEEISIYPTKVDMSYGWSAKFEVQGIPSNQVMWDVTSGGGTITSDGTYTAPNKEGVFEVTASDKSSPQTKAKASIRVFRPISDDEAKKVALNWIDQKYKTPEGVKITGKDVVITRLQCWVPSQGSPQTPCDQRRSLSQSGLSPWNVESAITLKGTKTDGGGKEEPWSDYIPDQPGDLAGVRIENPGGPLEDWFLIGPAESLAEAY